ncbi:MAG TPA: uridine diphosphate-N-acetylglucosamine-binding protein YvcK [Actinocrinis sp.]|nr:uridine diphosphate-N-acetylglucosamine-binding protein YvcK [Actinocrinis sp.]
MTDPHPDLPDGTDSSTRPGSTDRPDSPDGALGRAGHAPPEPDPAAPRPPLALAQTRVVTFGGGHGMYACLSALRQVTEQLTAVVTVADDGGSSGRIRGELGGLPPGDLRMALAALCGDDEWGRTWARALQHRFAGTGHLAGHALGNLLITALWEELGDPVAGLDWVARLLGARGRVLPMSAVPLEIEATVRGADPAAPDLVSTVRGQHSLAKTPGEVLAVRLLPQDPPAVPEAVAAIQEADWVILGPGSWFTSVLPHLLVPDLVEALTSTKARRLLILNLAPQAGETDGFTPKDHIDVLLAHAPNLRLDAILVDPGTLGAAAGASVGARADLGLVRPAPGDRPAEAGELAAVARRLGAEIYCAPVAVDGELPYHDPARLAEAVRHILL